MSPRLCVPTAVGRRRLLLAGIAAVLLAPMNFATRAQDGAARIPLAYPLRHDREQVEMLARVITEGREYIPGEALVKFRDGVSTGQQVRALSVARGGVDPVASRWLGDTLLVRATGEENAELFAAALARQPEIEWVQPNYVSRLKTTPNDPSYSRQWNLGLIGVPAAWDIGGGGAPTITVAVIDTGITETTAEQRLPLWDGSRILTFSVPFRQSPDISASRFVTGHDFALWNGPVLDMVGHGTQVASTILEETNNNLGLAGIAYNTRLMPLKACLGYWDLQVLMSAYGIPGYVDPGDGGSCSTSAVVEAVRYAADHGAQVINLSLGGPGASPAYLDAITYAVERGVFVAMAGGNEFEQGNPLEYPAAYGPRVEGAMTVGAVGRSMRRAFYSNTGPSIEVVAPGGDDRDGGVGGQIFQLGLYDPDFDPSAVVVPRFDRYYDRSDEGTSMASPHIAGVAALLYARGVTNPAAIEAAIRRFATDLGAPGRDDEYGAGLVDARATLRGLGAAR